ncbi:MAG TPA: hypothetical protein VIV61_05910 [Candidatus Ozemobacteraceae bacterium]
MFFTIVPMLGAPERTACIEYCIHEHYSAVGHAREADRIKSAFLATISHEVRSIIGFTGNILQELAGPLTTEHEEEPCKPPC